MDYQDRITLQDTAFNIMLDHYLYDLPDIPKMPNEYPTIAEIIYEEHKRQEYCKKKIKYEDLKTFLFIYPEGESKEWIKGQLAKIFVEIVSECSMSDFELLDNVVKDREYHNEL